MRLRVQRAMAGFSPRERYIVENRLLNDEGITLAEIGRTLKAVGVVASVDAWLDAAKREPASSSIGPGQYEMLSRMSAEAAVARMVDPDTRITNELLLPEGKTKAALVVGEDPLRWDRMASRLREADSVAAIAQALGAPASFRSARSSATSRRPRTSGPRRPPRGPG